MLDSGIDPQQWLRINNVRPWLKRGREALHCSQVIVGDVGVDGRPRGRVQEGLKRRKTRSSQQIVPRRPEGGPRAAGPTTLMESLS